jgi:transmembrane sensor
MSGGSEQFKIVRAKRSVPVETLEEEAASWLLRRHFFDWTPEDQLKLDAWLDESPSNRVTYWRLNAALSRTERLAALRAPMREEQPERSLFRSTLIRAVAAIALVTVTAATGLFYATKGEVQTISTAVGGHKLIKLSDGSRIELNTDTVIRIARWGRSVTLARGEAYFEIKHDAVHPFTVDVAGQRITDLGTTFVVRQSGDGVSVGLLEGRAQFESRNDPAQTREAVLTPGDFATATPQSFSVRQVPQKVLINELSWRRGVLVFHNTTLADAAREFNRYNQIKLIVEDAASQLEIDGTFSVNDPGTFTQIASDILHLHIEEQQGNTVLTR